jgi:murein DD-endopeptidase MepM/ murein hydrolase activator NlpD
MFSFKKIVLYTSIFTISILLCNICYSASIDEIKQKIAADTQSREQLQKEIDQYQSQLKDIGNQANSLSKAIKTIDTTEKKTSLDIQLTENNINSTNLEIEKLGIQIDDKSKEIDKNTKIISDLLNQVNETDSSSIIENLLKYKDLSEVWNEIQNIYVLQNQIQQKLYETKQVRDSLSTDKKDAEDKKKQLTILKSELADKKTILDINKTSKSKLLADTKNKESNYKQILAEKQALADAFDKELTQFESDLRLAIDPNSIPPAGSGVLSWPLDNVYITQKFGVTSDSGRLYVTGSHNGVDFRASVGTEVKAALSGTVLGVGDTDTVCPGASYGKWIFIRHANGLSTIYGHLSLIKVKAGDEVFTGDVIGYSGSTGYATGPHLHFGVMASQGSQIMSKKSAVCKGTYTIPMADIRAYLDPLIYL